MDDMVENDSFKIRMDEEPPDDAVNDEINDNRVDKLNTRITLIAVLIPCVLCVILAVGYVDMKRRVAMVRDTGTSSVQDLSKDLETRLSALYGEHGKLKDSLPDKFASLEKRFDSTKKSINKSVKKISVSKADEKQISKKLGEIKTSLESLDGEIGKITSEVKALDKKLNKSLIELNGALGDTAIDMQKLKVDQTELSSEKIDTASFYQAIEKLYESINKLDGKIQSIQKSKGTRSGTRPTAGTGSPAKQIQIPAPVSKPPAATDINQGVDKQPAVPDTGKIFEQDISE